MRRVNPRSLVPWLYSPLQLVDARAKWQLSGEVSGASELSVPQLAIDALDIGLSRVSTAKANVAESLTADLSGASSLQYRGDPGLVNTDVSGASSVEKLPSS